MKRSHDHGQSVSQSISQSSKVRSYPPPTRSSSRLQSHTRYLATTTTTTTTTTILVGTTYQYHKDSTLSSSFCRREKISGDTWNNDLSNLCCRGRYTIMVGGRPGWSSGRRRLCLLTLTDMSYFLNYPWPKRYAGRRRERLIRMGRIWRCLWTDRLTD